MITIIHGDDTTASRNYYFSLKEQASDATIFQGTSLTLNDITQALSGGGLFGDEISIYIEEFFSKRKASKEMEAIIKFLAQREADARIVLWESKELTAKQLSSFKKATQKHFTYPKTLFPFLDSMRPGNNQTMIRLFHETIQHEEAERVFAMIVRQMRLLLAIRDVTDNTIDEIKRLAPFARTKLEKQSQLFAEDELRRKFVELFEIDRGLKTGKLPYNLSQAVDFWLFAF